MLDRQARIRKGLDDFLKAWLMHLLSDIGNDWFLALFGPLQNQADFKDNSTRAVDTLLGPIPGFPNGVCHYI